MAKYFMTRQAKKRGVAALTVALAACLATGTLAACGETESTDPESETAATKSDSQLLKNGDFEFYGDNNLTERIKKLNLINTPDSWSRSTGSDSNGSAPASDAASGIVNTAEWDYFARPGRPFGSVDDALAHWTDEGVTAYDRIKFYEDFDISSSDDFEPYSDFAYTVDYDDIKGFWNSEANDYAVKNPRTHDYGTENAGDDASVLMIHNEKVTNGVYGTAQYYTSSTTITLSAGTAAELSVWVKTSNLRHYENLETSEGCGAYIGVTHTVGGQTLDQMQIKNINTETLNQSGENNGWVEYKLYVRASTFATSTFKIVLGLGFGSTTDMYETVNGYAFFDDLTCKIIDDDRYETATASLSAEYVCKTTDYGDEKKFIATAANKTYALDLYAGFTPADLTSSVSIGLTEEKYGGTTYTSATYRPVGLADDGYTQFVSVNGMRAVTDDSLLSAVLAADFENYPFDADAPLVMLMSKNGAPYTAKIKNDNVFLVPAERTLLVSFFVKTSAMDGFTGAAISVVDERGSETSIAAFDSTTLDPVDVDDELKDIYDGWTQCFFFVANDTETNKTFSLKCTYGPTTIVGSTGLDYTDGYAAFANFETYLMTDDEAGYASTGSRAVSVTLTDEASGSGKFDDVAQNNESSIETDVATPANYIGIVGGDKRVGGDQDSAFKDKPENVYAGLVNADYVSAYAGTDWKTAICSIAHQTGVLTDAMSADWWTSIFGDAQQPLVIVNQAAAAYGYIAYNASNISTSSTQRISVRVKVSQGAKAYVYLIDTSDAKKGYGSALSPDMPLIAYWYDDDGNVCKSDPSDKDFSKKTDVLYRLGENGLYTNAQDGSDSKTYANLANYAKDANGNLVTGEGTIAFYAKDGKYYAYYDEAKDAYSTEVSDFDHAAARYDYTDRTIPQACVTVDGTNADVANKWVTVSFNVKTGDTAKSYRLEVWSGARDGSETNPAGSYVLFDCNASTDGSSDYEALLADAVSALKKNPDNVDEDDKLKDAFYYAYTFYDDADYLRYDATTSDLTENPYASYKQSEKTESIAYLYYEDTTSVDGSPIYQTFLDYSLSDVTVEPDAADEDTTDEDTTDESATSTANVWLLASSGALVAALFLVIISMGIRRVLKTRSARPVRYKAPKAQKPVKPAKQKKQASDRDENDPYNE